MTQLKDTINELKNILENSSTPSQLDHHPWTKSLAVRQFLAENPSLETKSLGYQLLATLSALFRATMPSTPPRRGKRLDTSWGQFGILAVLYFAPFEHGTIRPSTLRDAWGRIDQIIPLYVFGKPEDAVPERDLNPYRLISQENEIAPTSTISDWHTKGLERLAQSFLQREQLLTVQLAELSIVLEPELVSQANDLAKTTSRGDLTKQFLLSRFQPIIELYHRHKRWVWLSLLVMVVLFGGWKAWHILSLTRVVKGDVNQLQALISADISPQVLADVGPMLGTAREDILALRAQTVPFLWVGRLFGWLPVYGGDLASAGDLLDLAAGLVIAGDEAYQGAAPLLEAVQSEGERPSIPEILDLLVAAQPRFTVAQEAVDEALAARVEIDTERLSPKTRPLLEKIDPYLPLLGDGMAALSALPKVMGADTYGPQTYLVLLQNEDELRATGGFITAAATVTVEQGEVISFMVEDSYALDDYSKLYPEPPWQLYEYMYSPIWVFRDSNWSPDFPTTATWAEYLYAYASAHAVDGVVAIDQEVIRLLLAAVGPVELEDAPEPATADNVIEFMRYARGPSLGEENWFEERKDFMRPLARALLLKLQDDPDVSWQELGRALLRALNERHILVQLDDPSMAALLADRGWDGALRPGQGDFLMVVDSNLGFNKVNAAVETEIRYDVDLSDVESPTATLTLTHHNPTVGDEPCRHAPYDTGDYGNLIARCYWDYLRVYTLADTQLLDATPHAIPGEWMIRGEPVPARVDILDNEGLVKENPDGSRAFGTLIVVPLAEQRETRFDFALPAEVLRANVRDDEWTYELHLQKQPGTLAVPLSLQVRLPAGAQVVSAEPQCDFQDGIWIVNTRLKTDVDISLTFRMP